MPFDIRKELGYSKASESHPCLFYITRTRMRVHEGHFRVNERQDPLTKVELNESPCRAFQGK
jgi:hypothetical protein